MDAILIAGPTAAGKSALAVEMAVRHGGVVVNADSMQVYSDLALLTARPEPDEMKGVEHRLYGHVDAAAPYSTGRWLEEAGAVLEDLRAEGKTAVFVGGTGLYFEALFGGLSQMPPVPPEIRESWRGRLEEEGALALHRLLAERDAATAARLDAADGQRIVRALEILEATGQPIGHFQSRRGEALLDPSRVRRIVLMPDRALLRARIDARFERMMAAGALGEVERLLARRLDPALPVMKAIGVRELSAYLQGNSTLADATERAKAASRQYAKRQATWFRNRFAEGWERHENVEETIDRTA